MTTLTLNQLATTNLIGLKVFGSWGMDAGCEYGIVINEYVDSYGKDIVIEWEDGRTKQADVNEVVMIEEHTNIDKVGIYIDMTGENLSYDNDQADEEKSDVEQRSPETILINSKLEIVKLSNQKFRISKNSYIMPSGYALYHPTLGFFSFEGDKQPYIPAGGKKALQSILNDGGLLSFDNSVWWLPMEA